MKLHFVQLAKKYLGLRGVVISKNLMAKPGINNDVSYFMLYRCWWFECVCVCIYVSKRDGVSRWFWFKLKCTPLVLFLC